MPTYFVSRHDGAHRWARILQRQGVLPHAIDYFVEHLDPAQTRRGDVVMGTLPLPVAAQLRARGVTYWNLDLQVPPSWRGQELTATQMAACAATLTEYRVTTKDTIDIAPRKPRPGRSGPGHAVTLMLVSHELMPQYLGFVHNPTPLVLLVVTAKMKDRAKALQTLLEAAPQPPQRINTTSFADDQDFAAQRRQAEDLLDLLLRKTPEFVTVNLTGGTKPMSMAFHEAARTLQRQGDPVRTDYVDTQNARIESLDLSPAAARPMQGAVDVKAAVLASGKADAGCGSASALFRDKMKRTELHALLLEQRGSLIGILNTLAQLARGELSGFSRRWDTAPAGRDGVQVLRPGSDEWRFKELSKALLGHLGSALAKHGVFSEVPTAGEDGSLRIAWRTPAEIDYLGGGWLEAHVAALIAAAAPDDWASDVQIGQDSGRNNEIDALVTCGNRSLLIEVKTAQLGRESSSDDGNKSSKGQDTIYKLDSIGHDLARNFSKNWLVSARPLSTVDLTRAKDKNIAVFAPDGDKADDGGATAALQKFNEALQKWVADSRLPNGMSRLDAAFRPLDVSREWVRKEHANAKGYTAPRTANQPAPAAKANRTPPAAFDQPKGKTAPRFRPR